MNNYEVELEKNKKRNEKFLKELSENMDEFFGTLEAFDNGTYWDQFL